MDILFINPGFKKMIDSIMEFQTEEESTYWSDPLFYFYKDLDKEEFKSLPYKDKRIFLTNELKQIYRENTSLLDQKVNEYNLLWKSYHRQINEALSEIFKVNVFNVFNDLKGEITLNPICPRYLKEKYFQVFYLNSAQGAIGMSLHEIIHFIWFYVWNKEFKDSYDEYERPSLKWILSEVVVKSIMSDERLSSINPYYPDECIYDYFKNIELNGILMLDEIERLFKSNNITDFMHKSYNYLQFNEESLRRQILDAESM